MDTFSISCRILLSRASYRDRASICVSKKESISVFIDKNSFLSGFGGVKKDAAGGMARDSRV